MLLLLVQCQKTKRECGSQLQAIWKAVTAAQTGSLSGGIHPGLSSVSTTESENYHKGSLMECELGLVGWIYTFITKSTSYLSVSTYMAFILNVSSRPNMTERAPAITSTFQASGMRTSERKRTCPCILRICFNGPYNTLPICHWPELNHTAISNYKGSWETYSFAWAHCQPK